MARINDPGSKPAPRVKSKPSTGPRSEVAANKGYGLKKANNFKQTRAYRGASRAGYLGGTTATKRAVLSNPTPSVEKRVASTSHAHRQLANQLYLQRIGRTLSGSSSIPTTRASAQRLLAIRQGKQVPLNADDIRAGLESLGLVHAKTSSGSGGLPLAMIGPEGLTAVSRAAGGLSGAAMVPTQAIRGIGHALLHHPGSTLKGTARELRDIVPATLAGLGKLGYEEVTGTIHGHPLKGFKDVGSAMAKDYARRYGPLLHGEKGLKQFENRIAKEGFGAEALDAATVATAGGATAGRALGKAARAGKLGERAQKIATEARPALRLSGGAKGARPQELSPNLFKAVTQKKLDVARARKLERVNSRAAKSDREVGKLPITPEPGAKEVVPYLRPAKAAGRAQRKAAALTKSRAVAALKSEQHALVDKLAGHKLLHLNPHERKAFYYVSTGQVPANAVEHGTQAIDEALAHREEMIRAHRTEHGVPQDMTRATNELRRIKHLRANIEKAFTPKLQETVRELRPLDYKVAREDPALASDQARLRRHAQQAEVLGVRRGEMPNGVYNPDETVSAFVKRINENASAKGLERPLYFPSERFANPDYASRAVGGTRAVREPFRYTGKNFAAGVQDTHPSVYLRGLARSIKRKHNWRLVADQYDQHAFQWSKVPGPHGTETGRTVGEQLSELQKRGIDSRDVAFWSPGRYRAALKTEASPEALAGETPAATGDIAKAVQDATIPGDKAGSYKTLSGFVVVPKAAHEEIMSATRPSGALGRSLDLLKGKQSRVILGSANVPWLGFQVASNAVLTGLTLGGKLHHLAQAPAWWKTLNDTQKAEIDRYVNTGAFHGEPNDVHLGSTQHSLPKFAKQFADGWDAFKRTPAFRHGGKLNVIEHMFKADHAQNVFFRKAILYNSVKKEAFRRMTESAGETSSLIDHITRAFKLPPKEQVDALLKDEPTLERFAGRVNDMLGDWTTFTSKERMTLRRYAMFYGFLRYSLRLAFYVMPVQHPIATAMLANLGRLQADETRQLLGGDELPFAFGRIYFTQNGKLEMIDVSRANPALNIVNDVMGATNPVGKIASALPTIPFGIALDQAAEKSLFNDKPWLVAGETTPRDHRLGYGLGDRSRVALEQILQMAYPYRAGEKLSPAMQGPQGNDSLLFSPRPTQYKSQQVLSSIAADKRRTGTDPNRIWSQLLPFVPQASDDPALAKELRDRIAELKGQSKKKSKGLSLPKLTMPALPQLGGTP